MKTKHGMCHTPIYYAWRSMNDRCRRDRHPGWQNYGGRGITVCPEWQRSFLAFYLDMSPTYQPGLSIDRIDNSRGYGPDNCRWATSKQQSRNRRNNVLIDTPTGRVVLADAAARLGVDPQKLKRRWLAGEQIVLPPPRLHH